MAAPLRAIIFDFDGVILDSNALKTRVFEMVFARFPQHVADMMAYHHAHVSESRYDKFRHLVEDLLGREGDVQLVEQLAEEFAWHLRDGMDRCPFVPGARELLDELSPRLPLFLASVTPEPELLRLVEVHGLRHHFRRIFGCPPWTKAAAVGTIVSSLHGPDGVALIGDSAGDQRAAAEHGVEFIPRDSGLPFDPPLDATSEIAAIASQIRTRLLA